MIGTNMTYSHFFLFKKKTTLLNTRAQETSLKKQKYKTAILN